MRVALAIFAGVVVFGLIDYYLDRVWRPSRLRSAFLSGMGVLLALKAGDLFGK